MIESIGKVRREGKGDCHHAVFQSPSQEMCIRLEEA